MEKIHKSQTKLGQTKLGFSLIELSIVILIVSILITGSLSVSKTNVNNSKAAITKARIDTIYKAFTNFISINRRLPCPALLTVAKGSSTYGNETATPGTCTNTYVSSTNAPNLVYGMVPITALGLDPDMAEDGWGTKFTYVADKRFTKASVSTASSDGFEIIEGTPSEYSVTNSVDLAGIDVQGPSSTSLLPTYKNGIFLLVSHGANKYKGFNATGTAQNTTAGVTDENQNSCDENSGCSTSGTTSFDRVFIAYSTSADFDDIVLFKTKSQLVRDAGLEFIICSGAEAKTASYTWTTNGNYSCNVCSGTANNQKTCGKFGAWTSVASTTCTANMAVCPTSITGSVIQLQRAITTAGFTSASSSWTDWTGMSVTITQTSGRASNSLFKISFSSGASNTNGNSFQYVKLVRVVGGSPTDIAIGDVASSAQRSWVDAAFGNPSGSTYLSTLKPLTGVYVDAPATSSAITYKLQVKVTNGGTAYFGRTSNIADGNRSAIPSVLIVEEIAQ